MNEVAYLTYVHTLMIPLTRSCGVDCTYCLFRENDAPMLTFDEIETLIRRYYHTGIMEVLIESGQALDKNPFIRQQWENQGYASFAHYLRDIGQLVLENHLLPSLEVGPLTFTELEIVSPVIASITIALEHANPSLAKALHPAKNIDAKIESLSDAGILQIPAHTGLLIGIGETMQDRFTTIDVIADIHAKYRHIQSFSIQFLHTSGSEVPTGFRYDDLCTLVRYARTHLPDVAISVPVTAPAFWTEAIGEGISDLGRMYEGSDGIDRHREYPKISECEKMLARKGFSLRPRFPAMPASFPLLQRSDRLWAVCREWLNKHDYAYYRN